MEILTATFDDADEISDLDIQLFDNGHGPYTFRREIDHGWCGILRDAGEIVAFALVRPGSLGDLLRLGVRPSHQRQGLGRKLLEHVLYRFPGPMMLMVRKDNLGAKRLYDSFGFRIVAVAERSWVMVHMGEDVYSAPQEHLKTGEPSAL